MTQTDLRSTTPTKPTNITTTAGPQTSSPPYCQAYASHRQATGVGRTRAILASLFILGALLAACSSASAQGLFDTAWELTSLSGSELLSGTTITLTFAEDELSGSAGCNHYGGSYTVSGDSLVVSDLYATEMACPEPPGILEQEQVYLATLSGAASYRLTGDRLEILDEAGAPTLLFVTPDAASTAQEEDAPRQADTPLAEDGYVTQVAPPTPTAEPTPAPVASAEATAPPVDPPPGFMAYEDAAAGVSLYLPQSWTVTQVFPGQSAILQSYPEDKYVGGEARDPSDTKCDLTIRPPDVDLDTHLRELRSDPSITILSEEEIILESGQPGIRLEVSSMGQSRSLIATIHDRVVVLSCFGDFTLFDQIAVTLHSNE